MSRTRYGIWQWNCSFRVRCTSLSSSTQLIFSSTSSSHTSLSKCAKTNGRVAPSSLHFIVIKNVQKNSGNRCTSTVSQCSSLDCCVARFRLKILFEKSLKISHYLTLRRLFLTTFLSKNINSSQISSRFATALPPRTCNSFSTPSPMWCVIGMAWGEIAK